MSDLDMNLNRIPEEVKTVHFMGICGTGMGSLAGMLKETGFQVTGSDMQVYPPMSTFLEFLGIPVFKGYGAANLEHGPDLVIVGNVITRQNEEAIALAERRIPFVSFPQALNHFFLASKVSIVVAGTHGKTTTSSLLASILDSAGLDPGCMIGGIVQGFGRNYRLGTGKYFVVEGDEYDTAFFDKGPKFLHYKPDMAILTSVEFDHADIYEDFDAVKAAFRSLVRIMPPNGVLVAYEDADAVREVVGDAECHIVGYGQGGGQDLSWTLKDCSVEGQKTKFSVLKDGRAYGEFISPLLGVHNALNTVSVIAILDRIGLAREEIQAGLSAFKGIRRRQEVRGVKNGITIMDDFAHHPTAVRETLSALRLAYPDNRLVAVFEPRTNSSRRKVFQQEYALSFDCADCIIVRDAPGLEKIPPEERFSSRTLVEDLTARNKKAYYFPDTGGIVEFLLKRSVPGDVLAIMSNGGFDNIHQELLERL
ncbi:MAG: UDP-N-acetylmuramate:L-alanyl-gamma-D-glutamyl-meso-diaminopimelate ligase [Pseudomonadota bacterium]